MVLSYDINFCCSGKPKEILRGVSGHFRPGKLTAILGPSGAGKTSLLNILAGQITSNLQGCITVNGVKKTSQALQKQCCYIPQEFALTPLLTVKETFFIAAQLKLSHPHTSDSRGLIVSTLHVLNNNLGEIRF